MKSYLKRSFQTLDSGQKVSQSIIQAAVSEKINPFQCFADGVSAESLDKIAKDYQLGKRQADSEEKGLWGLCLVSKVESFVAFPYKLFSFVSIFGVHCVSSRTFERKSRSLASATSRLQRRPLSQPPKSPAPQTCFFFILRFYFSRDKNEILPSTINLVLVMFVPRAVLFFYAPKTWHTIALAPRSLSKLASLTHITGPSLTYFANLFSNNFFP